MNEIVSALNCTFQGTSDQVQHAYQFLSSLSNNPDYHSYLINIIINNDFPELTRIAASIQLKYLVSNSDIISNFSFENISEILLKSPPLVQRQLQLILKMFVNNCLTQNQNIPILLQIISNCLTQNSDINYIFIGLGIIRFVFKSDRRIFPGIGDKSSLARHLSPLFQPICMFALSNPNEFLLHYVLLTANVLLNFSDLQPIENWVRLIVSILQSNNCADNNLLNNDLINNNNETKSGINNTLNFNNKSMFDIDKDALKFATSFIELRQKIFLPNFAFAIFNAITNKLLTNMSYKGVLYSFRYYNQFMSFECYSILINNLLKDFVLKIIFHFFVLTDEEQQLMNEDLPNFLLHRNPVFYDYITPFSGSLKLLSTILKKNSNIIPELVFFCESEINLLHDSNEIGKIFGITQFASILANHFESTEFVDAFLRTLNGKKGLIYAVSFFMFLSNIKNINNFDLNLLVLNNIINGSVPQIVKYYSAISIPIFFTFFEAKLIIEKIGQDLPNIIQNLLILNTNYPTISMSSVTRLVFQYFINYLEPVAIESARELFSIYWQLSNDDNENISETCSTIIGIIQMMKGKSIEFFDQTMQITMKMIMEINPNFYSNLFDIMKYLVINTPGFSHIFFQIPEFLKCVDSNLCLVDDFPNIIEILKFVALRASNDLFSQQNEFFMPFISILENFISSKSLDEIEGIAEENIFCISAINKLTQIIFLVLKRQDFFSQFLELFTKLNSAYFADSIAALAAISPNITFLNELNFRLCLNNSSPAAFLSAFLSVIQNWNEMPEIVLINQQEIKNRIQQSIIDLQNEINISNMNVTNEEMANFAEDDETELPELLSSNTTSNREDSDIFNFHQLICVFQSM